MRNLSKAFFVAALLALLSVSALGQGFPPITVTDANTGDKVVQPKNIIFVGGITIDGKTVTVPLAGGAAGVTTFNGRAGIVVPIAGDYTFGLIGGTITNAMVDPAANIALSKLAITGTPTTSTFLRGDGAWTALPAAPVTSVFGRTGVVVSATNDYDFTQISGTIVNSMIDAAADISLSKLDTTGTADNTTFLRGDGAWAVPPGAGGSVASFNGRTGVVVSATNDYSFAQISGSITNSMVDAAAAIALSKLAITGTANNTTFLRGDSVWTALNTLLADPGGNGILARGSAGTTTARTITGTTNEVTITNGDGVSGNPTLALADSFSLTGKTRTAPIKTGTATPGTCTVGDYFYDTDATAGLNTFACTATNTWTLQGDGVGTGDVVGPGSATDNAVVRFDLTTGKLIQDSAVTIADSSGNVAGLGTLNTHTLPGGTDTIALLAASQTFTNKTLTTPTITSFVNSTHNHENAAGGGTLSAAAITTGTLSIARGGTGVSLADPDADRIFFWDDSAGQFAFL